MADKRLVEEFIGQAKLAVVGVSASGKRFGAAAYKELKRQGYDLVAVHPTAGTIQGDPCVARVADLPDDVGGLLVVVPPAQAEAIVTEAADGGVPRVWLQPGAQSEAALRLCEERGLPVVAGECILMHARGSRGLHAFHRWLWGLLGRLP